MTRLALEVLRFKGWIGFGNKWCKWIEACLKSSSTSILVNGSPLEELGVKRGVRQGDPLVPFLFILATEGLNAIMSEMVEKGVFRGVKIGVEIDWVRVDFTSSCLGVFGDGRDIRKEGSVLDKGYWVNNEWNWAWEWNKNISGWVCREYEDLIEVLRNVVVSNTCRDRWRWTLEEDDKFKVKTLTSLIEEKIIQVDSGGRLSVHVELNKRGIDLDSVLCASCNDSVESCAHCLVTCDLAMSVGSFFCATTSMGVVWFCSSVNSIMGVKVLQLHKGMNFVVVVVVAVNVTVAIVVVVVVDDVVVVVVVAVVSPSVVVAVVVIMPLRRKTRSAGRSTVAPRGGRMGGRTSRGGGRTGEPTDRVGGRTSDQDGQGGDQGNRLNGGVDEFLDFSTVIVPQLQDLLPTIIAQVGNRVKTQGNNENQNDNVINDNIQGDVRNVNVNNGRGRCPYKEFLACNPKDFDGNGGAISYTRWTEKMESVQDISGCGDNQKVKYTAGSLIGKTLTWWNNQVQTRGQEVIVSMIWEYFKTLMREAFCPNNEMQKLESEFWCHAMVGAGHAAYID
ncbi:reverse transcriptase domain-containing protein [Tanacetum coccineum]